MKAKDLIRVLQRLDPEAKVLFENTSMYEDGYYTVDDIDSSDGYLILESNYKTEYSDVI